VVFMTQQRLTLEEALRWAREDVFFLVRLDKDELEKSGFYTSTFGSFEYVDIFPLWDGDEYMLKYEFDSDPRRTHYERPGMLGVGKEDFMKGIETYLRLAQERGNSRPFGLVQVREDLNYTL